MSTIREISKISDERAEQILSVLDSIPAPNKTITNNIFDYICYFKTCIENLESSTTDPAELRYGYIMIGVKIGVNFMEK